MNIRTAAGMRCQIGNNAFDCLFGGVIATHNINPYFHLNTLACYGLLEKEIAGKLYQNTNYRLLSLHYSAAVPVSSAGVLSITTLPLYTNFPSLQCAR